MNKRDESDENTVTIKWQDLNKRGFVSGSDKMLQLMTESLLI